LVTPPTLSGNGGPGWNAPTYHIEAFHRLSHKLHQTAKALKTWANSLLSDSRLKLHMAQEVILRLDKAQEFLNITTKETCIFIFHLLASP
jgi:hypothetical protein